MPHSRTSDYYMTLNGVYSALVSSSRMRVAASSLSDAKRIAYSFSAREAISRCRKTFSAAYAAVFSSFT